VVRKTEGGSVKILNRQQFLALTDDVLFSKYKPCYFENIEIKHQSLESNDYIYQNIVDAIDCNSSDEFSYKLELAENGASIDLDFNCAGRDGCFDDDQLFAVWEKKDVQMLINKLSTLIT